MPDPTGQDQDQGLPLDFYGKSYLGRDVHVGVQGESPSAAGEAASPTGALGVGPTGAGPGPASATKQTGTASSGAAGGATTLATLLQSLGLGQKIGQAIGQEAGAGSASTAAVSGGEITAAGVPPINAPFVTDPSGFAAVDVATHQGLTPDQVSALAQQEAASGGGPSSSSGQTIPGPIAAAGIGDIAAHLAGLNVPQQAEQSLSALTAALGLATGNPIELIGGLLGFGGSFFGGPPPAISFPANTWSQLGAQVKKHLPQAIPVPTNATEEQRKAIEAANWQIEDLKFYEGPMPANLGGVQSAETWNNVWNAELGGVKSRFKKLQDLYPKALQAYAQANAPASSGNAALANVEPPPPPDTGSVLAPGFFEGQDQEKKKGSE